MEKLLRPRETYGFGRFRLDALRRTLSRDGRPVAVSGRVFDTLLYLIENSGRVVEKEELLNAVWAGRFVEEANLSQTIFVLRRALKEAGENDSLIATVPGHGYSFAAPVVRGGGRTTAVTKPATEDAPITFEQRASTAMLAETAGTDEQAQLAAPRRRLIAAIAGAALAGTLIFLPRWLAFTGAPHAFHPPPHSVAVLAFANMSGDVGQDYLADGFSEELINTLGGVNSLRVADRNSAFYFKSHPAPVSEIARQLNVGAVLEGSLRRQGQRLRITVELIDISSGYQFWSHAYDRNFGDILKVQREIAEDVTRSLRATLDAGDPMQSSMGGTTDSAAFDAYLRGLRLMDGRDEPSYQSALAAFDDAARLDPHYAGAQNMRAVVLSFLAGFGSSDGRHAVHDAELKALDAANRAVALAPGWGQAHAARGEVLMRMLDLAGAERELSRAQALAPNDSRVDRAYANLESCLDRHAAAEAAIARVVARYPTEAGGYWDQASVFYFDRRFGDSLTASRHAAALTATEPPGDRALSGLAWLQLKNPGAAHDACAPNRAWQETLCLAIAAYQLGRATEAQTQLAKLHRSLGDSGAYQYAQVYAQWGDRNSAIAWLNTAWRLRDTGLVMLKTDPLLDPLRGAPEFSGIEQHLGFPE